VTLDAYAPPPTPVPLAERSASQRAGDLVAWAEAASAAHQLAVAITGTAFVPESFKNRPDDAAVAILMGAEVGLSPLQALGGLFVVRGRPGMYARAQVALVLSRGHEVWTAEETPDRVVVMGRRAGGDHVERSEWTMNRAKAEGLYRQNQRQYDAHPIAMLYARAATDVCRRIAPDVLLGIPEAVAPDPDGEVGPGSGAATTVQRRRPAPPAPDLPAPPDYTPPPTRPVQDVPAPALTGDAPEPEPDEADDEDPPNDDEGEPAITDAQRARLHAEFRGAGMDRPTYLAWSSRVLEVDPPLDTLAGLRVTEASTLLDRIEAIKATRARNAEPEPIKPGDTVTDEDMRDNPRN